MNIGFIIVIIIASLLEYLGDSNFKFYARNYENKFLVYGAMSYMVMIYVLIRILQHSNVMYMNLNWDAFSIVLETIFAYIVLGETLDNKYQFTGFIFIICGIILLNIGNVPY